MSNFINIVQRPTGWVAGLLLMMFSHLAPAVTNVTVKVTVIAPLSCEINGNKPILVDFGNAVRTDKVDGKNYLKDVNYDISCKSVAKNALKMKISANTAGFDSKAVNTNKSDLGIALYNGSSRLSVNEWFNFTWPNKPVLKAVPVKNPTATLQPGGFSGTATMLVDYQ